MLDSAIQDNEKLDFKRILPIFVIVLVDLLGLTIIIPLLPLYAAAFGANALMIGLIGAAYPTMQLLGSPILGSLSDRFGRKPVLIVSQIGTFIGFLMLGFANVLPILLISRMIDGISGANIVTAQAAITDSTSPKNRAQGLGMIGAAFGLGFILGPVIAGIALAISGNDYRVPAFIAAGFSLISIILTSVWFKETHPEEARITQQKKQQGSILSKIFSTLTNPLLAILMILVFTHRFVFGGFEQLLPLFTLVRLGLDGIGNAVLFVFVGIILVVIQGYYIGPLSRRFGEVRLIYAGLVLLALGLTMVSLTPKQAVNWYSREAMIESFNETAALGAEDSRYQLEVPLPDDENKGWFGLGWMLLALLPTAIGGGILTPSLNSLITQRISAADIGSALGVSTALVSAANAITPLISGSIFQFFGSTAPFLLGGLILCLLMIVATQNLSDTKTIKASPA